MEQSKKNSPSGSSKKEADLHKHLDDIQKELKDLKSRIGTARRSDFNMISHDTAKRISTTANEIIKTSSDLLEKAIKVVQYSASGALEGGRKALSEKEGGRGKPRKKKSGTKKTTSKSGK